MRHFCWVFIYFLFLTILVTGEFKTATAETIHVPGDQATIQAGLYVAEFGDTVLVAPGIYYENILWPETNGIKLIGSGQDSCVIDGSNAASVIRFESASTVDTLTLIRGFTITNGNALPPWPQSLGGGILVSADPILEYLTIIGNTADDFGGGLFISGSPIIRYVLIANNIAISHGGVDCTAAGAPTFDHVTAVGNDPGGLYFDTNGYPVITNSIVAFNEDYGIRVDGTSFSPTTIGLGYSDIYDAVQRIGFSSVDTLGPVIAADPLFVDLNNDDYHLLPGSPCIDAGDPNYPLDPDGTNTDMGAFYFPQTTAISESPELPDRILVHQNYPNPFNARTTINFELSKSSPISLGIYDMLGRKIETPANNKSYPAGNHQITWNAADISSGTYFYKITVEGFSETSKMLLIK